MGRSTGKDEMEAFQNNLLCGWHGEEKEILIVRIKFNQAKEL